MTPEAVDQAIATGADFVGFVHHPASPRHLELAAIKPLIEHARGRIQTVVVTVNPNDALVDSIHHLRPDYLQVHNVDSPHRIDAIRARCEGMGIITAISVDEHTNFNHAKSLAMASDFLLLDAKNPGSGKPFDWQLLAGQHFATPWFLAGGLNATNVAHALHITSAPMVDVSSGIESSPGIKSLEKIAAFNQAVLSRDS